MKLYNYIKDINIDGIKSAFQLLSFFHSDKGKSILNAISKDKFLIDYEKMTVEKAKEYMLLLNISELIVSLINNDPDIENLFPAEVKNAFMNVYCKLIPWKEMFEGIINIDNFDAEHYVLKKGSIIQSKKILAAKLEF
ncbi:MAG: hypothetical protein FVQ77_12675 [Cytophagales bacterium]|nr:hypothetical protein [Cytophagales bacterium]